LGTDRPEPGVLVPHTGFCDEADAAPVLRRLAASSRMPSTAPARITEVEGR
jgi:hypothetical protein